MICVHIRYIYALVSVVTNRCFDSFYKNNLMFSTIQNNKKKQKRNSYVNYKEIVYYLFCIWFGSTSRFSLIKISCGNHSSKTMVDPVNSIYKNIKCDYGKNPGSRSEKSCVIPWLLDAFNNIHNQIQLKPSETLEVVTISYWWSTGRLGQVWNKTMHG